MTRLVSLRDAITMIREAIEWMAAQDEKRRPFVVVESKETQRFVQFCTKDGDIILDLPGRKDNLPKYRLAQEMFGDPVLWNCRTVTGLSYQKKCAGVEDAVALALATLTQCLVVESTDTLIVEQDCIELPN